MNERVIAIKIAHRWLEFQMNSLTQMVPGDPDCDACVLARQYLRAIDLIGQLERERLGPLEPAQSQGDSALAQAQDKHEQDQG